MELVDGQDLRTRIRHSPLPLAEIAVIGAGVSDALAYVHSLGIIHRDIKPANILLVPVRPGEPLRPKLTDFGIARMMDGTRLTATGTMVGTAAYLSPEQSRGADLGPASDIYSLGLVLLECIKGEVEYPGSAVESAVARLHRAPAIPDAVPAEWASPDPGHDSAGPPGPSVRSGPRGGAAAGPGLARGASRPPGRRAHPGAARPSGPAPAATFRGDRLPE